MENNDQKIHSFTYLKEIEDRINFSISAIDKTMIRFEYIVNTSPEMNNIRVRWSKSIGSPHGSLRGTGQVDYWAGIAKSAYEKEVITIDQFKEILLALRGIADSAYLNKIIKQILST